MLPHAGRVIKSIWQWELKCYLLWFYVLLQMVSSCNYHFGSAVKICGKKKTKKNWGLFICTTAVYSGELDPSSPQLCIVTKVRNSIFVFYRQNKLFLNCKTEETLAQCCFCESKSGFDEVCQQIWHVHCVQTKIRLRKDIYLHIPRAFIHLFPSSRFFRGYSLVSSPFLLNQRCKLSKARLLWCWVHNWNTREGCDVITA